MLLAGKTHFRSDPSLSPNDMTSPVTLTGDFAALGNGDQAKIEGEATVILRSDGQELALLNGCFA